MSSGTQNDNLPAIVHALNASRQHDAGEQSQDTDKIQQDDSQLLTDTTMTRTRPQRMGDHFLSDEDEQALYRIATQHSTRSQPGGPTRTNTLNRMDTIAELDVHDPVLDPSKAEFDIYKWAKVKMRAAQEQDVKLRRTGFVTRNLNVSGSGSALNIQQTVGSGLLAPFKSVASIGHKKVHKRILTQFDSVLKEGELLVVLGRPGSGCSTYLKTICGETLGLEVELESVIHYNGIDQETMLKRFKGEVVYNQEVDKHFPHLTVGQTLEFAAAVRAPQTRLGGDTRAEYTKQMVAVTMAVFGLSHTYNTKVGNDFVRGVSGGERKRVSIAEMALAGAPLCCWDNSTRGLDASTALEFVKSLRMSAHIFGSSHAVSIYQASQAIYDQFDKAIVLYEGRQIYYGRADQARKYFEDMGWECPARQTTGDFLTSVTNPQERRSKEGFKSKVPRTPKDFEAYWRKSENYRALLQEIEDHEKEYPIKGDVALENFMESRKSMQANHVRPKSPYTISIAMQVGLCTKRAYQRVWNDKTSTITTIIGEIVMALIIGSIFYGTPNTTDGLFAKGGTLFFAILFNALMAITEINTLYDQRPIVEKHASYAFYHPFTEALAGIISDIPVKFSIAAAFNVVLYFMSGLRRTAAAFFVYFLFSFMALLTMSMIFRTLAASTKTISQALAMAGVMVLAVVIYTGYTLPIPYMHPWFRWINYINPVGYAYESLLANELHGQSFPCAATALVPAGPDYQDLTGPTFVCGVRGAVVGESSVSGDAFLSAAYNFSYSHIWRNLGFLFAFLLFFLTIYLAATEFNSSTTSTAEFLVFRRGRVPKYVIEAGKEDSDEEAQKKDVNGDINHDSVGGEKIETIPAQKDLFTWRDVTYDISIKGEPRRLLAHVSGWVKPGTLTALMGVSGAGKTTLLDVLAQRTSIGVITGDMLVNGNPRDASFQRKTGYVQQQDLHLETSTVREALRFSALLRQPKTVPKVEKYEFVEEVINMLKMEDFAEAVVGTPGEGLNIEQRKLLTIGVELAAKPALLLFLDEPTSGLDSQSSYAIIAFLRKLADNGQAVLSTIHQPSSILFEQFDRLLFLAKGGRTVYFGDIGKSSRTLLEYFENNGGRKCNDEENPAEYMLEVVGAGATGKSTQDWAQVWRDSGESKSIQNEMVQLHDKARKERDERPRQVAEHAEFAMPFFTQLVAHTVRVFQQYWRTPSYIYGKFALGFASALFIGFSFFQSDNSQQGLQNQVFSIFMLTSIFSPLVQQIMPRFVTQRALYEVRERPSKAYSWAAFLIANIVVEIPYQVILGIGVFGGYYYPIYGIESIERQGLVLLYCIQFFVFISTFAHMIIAALPDAETAGNIGTLLFSLTLVFNGVMQPPSSLPGFWVFMYRVSPLTYLVEGIAGTGIAGKMVQCASEEFSVFDPPAGQNCGQYLSSYLAGAPGSLFNADATSGCQYCPLSGSDQFLSSDAITYDHRWRDFGILWAYVAFNISVAVLFYWAFRVKKWKSSSFKKVPKRVFGWVDVGGSGLKALLTKGKNQKGRENRNDHII